MKRLFHIKAIWDADAKVFVSESDIIGFHIEAETLDEFEDLMSELAVELIVENHFSANDLASTSLRDLVPGIVWQRPDTAFAAGA
ncbi:MAG: DUF1902 domain-containing protein [Pseudomonadota bacterium]